MAAWQLAKRGHDVTVFDQWNSPNDRGASAGESRIFRTIYKEGPEYVEFLRKSGQMWLELESAQDTIRAPVAGQLDGRAHQVALMFFELGFETFLQGEGVCGSAGEASQYPVVIEAPDLARRALDDDVAERDLAVTAQSDFLPAPDADDRGGVKLFHGNPCCEPFIWGCDSRIQGTVPHWHSNERGTGGPGSCKPCGGAG